MSCLVIGRGVSGYGAEKLCKALMMPVNVVTDGEVSPADFDSLFKDVELVVLSPGVLPSSPLLQEAQRRKLVIESELQFGARHLGCRILAVTGTNGKTTTVELAAHLLETLQIPTISAGNIGLPLSEVAADMLNAPAADKIQAAVVEVSSFQLEHTDKLGASAAVILNVESDHLNRYPGGMSEYKAVKEKIFLNVPEENRFYGCSMAEYTGGDFHIDNDRLYFQDTPVVDLKITALNAPHNRENLLAALALINSYAPLAERLAETAAGILSFHPGAHRLEEVASVRGVRFVNDSKATNPAAVIAALKALKSAPDGSIVLLAGGLDKSMDFSVLRQYADYLRAAVLYGACAGEIDAALAGAVEIRRAGSFEGAFAEAVANALPGDIVLLSPAAASMDMFKDYKARGDAFKQLVRQLM